MATQMIKNFLPIVPTDFCEDKPASLSLYEGHNMSVFIFFSCLC